MRRAGAASNLMQAIHEFNAGEFFEQHETLELLWRATPGEIRHLYEGILQIGVGMHHLLTNRNFHGAAVKLDHGIRLLSAFPDAATGWTSRDCDATRTRARAALVRWARRAGRVPTRAHAARASDADEP